MSGDDLHGFTSLCLSEAVLCANCDMISNSLSKCLCCGSTATMPLASLLGALRGGSTARVVQKEWSEHAEIPKMMPRRAA